MIVDYHAKNCIYNGSTTPVIFLCMFTTLIQTIHENTCVCVFMYITIRKYIFISLLHGRDIPLHYIQKQLYLFYTCTRFIKSYAVRYWEVVVWLKKILTCTHPPYFSFFLNNFQTRNLFIIHTIYNTDQVISNFTWRESKKVRYISNYYWSLFISKYWWWHAWKWHYSCISFIESLVFMCNTHFHKHVNK